MNRRQAKRYVLLALFAVSIVATVGPIVAGRGLPSVTVGVSIFVVGLFLALLAEVLPSLAGGLAVLILVSTLLSGGRVWTAVAEFARSSAPIVAGPFGGIPRP